MKTFLKDLELKGFQINIAMTSALIQIDGWLPTGETFYYRSRGTRAKLQIATNASKEKIEMEDKQDKTISFMALYDHIQENIIFEDSIVKWEWPDAGYLSEAETKKTFEELFSRFEEQKEKNLT